MTLLEINLTDVLSETDPDDRVIVWAPAFREGPAGRLVGPRRKSIPLVDGVGSDEVVPGPLMVQVQCKAMSDTSPREVVVPEEGPVTLTGLLDTAGVFHYAPPVVGRVAQLRDEAEAARDVSMEAAAAAVAGGETAAATAVTNVETLLSGYVASAEDAAVRAEGVADAFGSLEGVADQVQAASDAADRAENVVDTVQWQGDQLSVMGKVSPPLTGDDGATPYVGENGTWWVGETDTGVRAQGEKGDPGDGAGDGTGDVLWSELNPVLDGKAAVSHDHTASQISDATTVGRNVLTASSQAAARQAIGAGTSSLALGTTSVTAKAGNYQPTAANITDATTVGRNVLKAADAAAARTAIGAGTSNLALGSTSSTAAPGNHTHAEYAASSRVTTLEGSQPIIVSSLPASPMPGRIYLVTGA